MRHFIHTSTDQRFTYGGAEGLSIEDVAHHLSGVNRFSGATKFSYSVGQHSLLVEQLVAFCFPQTPVHVRRHALLHDAHEAVMGDIPTPFQRWFTQEFGKGKDLLESAKARLDSQIMPALGVSWPPRSSEMSIVHSCDKYAFVIEAKQLFNKVPDWLPDYIAAHQLERFQGIDYQIGHMLRSEVREVFLSRWRELQHDEEEIRRAS